MLRLLSEAVIVAILLLVIGLITSYGIMYVQDPKSLENFDHWKAVGASFLIAGFTTHLVCEFTKLNSWYCKNGNACL